MTERSTSLFNSPQETALRIGAVLSALAPEPVDLQRLIFLDYLLVHSEDADGPPSLHPASPMRTGEVLVRRELIERAVLLLCSKGLATRVLDPSGIQYAASEHLGGFLEALMSEYAVEVRARGKWVAASFGRATTAEMQATLRGVADVWAAEFDIAEDRDE